MREIIVDNFAGGGGASTGIALALGRAPDVAVNHDPEAVAMHEANHPETLHLCGDVWEYDPREVAQGRPVGLLWASPDCKHFSKAKGGQPARSKKVRALAWVVVRWAKTVAPRVIILENVEEFQGWGPLDDAGRPDAAKKGTTFRRWVAELRRHGYAVEWKMLRACDYGAPTTRRRLFVIARRDGAPIVWPEPTHGPGRWLPYRAAASCIDFTLPVPSIFGRPRPLADATMRRIARGVKRFVVGETSPFIIAEAGGAAHALVQTGYGERPGQAPRALDLGQPMGTVVAGGVKQALVAAFLAKHYGGNETPGSSLERPFDTITCKDHHSLVTVTHGRDRRADVEAFLAAHDVPSTLRFRHETFAIVDIGMRMLTPRELFLGQGFPADYVIDPVVNGRRLGATAQTRMGGNSVSPMVARALVAANYSDQPMRAAA